ncbi:hypothetical protein A2230_00705 [candidate division WOR-1 bacterium RIFOXYA2_FULL_36_21]|uniref:Glycosyl transferase family 1 n=1 Tax=candidate division WOR-1 bacterium RIFOXYB2_FULL_36_35 TaxID=1802578 RepID=A0A1F4S0Z0_UNCSA|nr:MAG: hypothetical protein A2230_00705 [candidate division WOR-1 bacterium RIFOXYA2_FULL_36_21]OGC14094.1 MAG: hypothetical protein A2290_06280 [candidate division WOR-1 bacterium RIFOXYB2_FULL_36_35]OGC16530.1 MAG: hypothetical protein A2282_02230 [candidate division WOR-1 bacterium RIFOXYA12_FULL_36_13]
MRIAIFADSYKPYISGVSCSIDTLVRELKTLGHTVYIFAPSYPGHKERDPNIFRFPSLPTGYPKFRFAIPFVKNFPQVDIIHTHSPFQAGLLARFLAGRNDLPLVYTFHTLFTKYLHYANFLPKRFAKMSIVAYLQSFCKRADLIIAPSMMSKRVLKKWGITARCEIVPSGVAFINFKGNEFQSLKAEARSLLKIPNEAKVLLTVSRISKEKNISFIIEAFEKLNREDSHLVVIGNGPLLPELKNKKRKNIIWAGEFSHEELAKLYYAGDVFVFASTTETQGLVLAEAKGAGLPVIALFAGGLADTVRSGIDGYLTSRNILAFNEHINRLLNDEGLRKAMGSEAKRDAQERFSAPHIAKQIESLYNSLLR